MRKMSLMAMVVVSGITFMGCDKKEGGGGSSGGGSATRPAQPGAGTALSGASYDALAKAMMGTMTKVTDTLKSIKDEASAKAAAPKLKAIESEFTAIGARLKALGTPKPEEKKRLDAAYDKPMKDLGTAMGQEMVRIQQDPKLAAATKESIESLMKAIQSIKMDEE